MSHSSLFSLENKVIILTGGYGYLGKAMADGLLDSGATVIIGGRTEAKFNAAFPTVNPKLSFKQLDIFKAEDFKNLFASVYSEFGHIDAVINNATHISASGSPEEITDEAFDKTMDGAVRAVYSSIREVLPWFKKQGFGRIVNIGSMYGIVSPDFEVYSETPEFINPPHYGAAKAGLIQLTRYFASYLGKHGIQVNAISPGPFPSENVQKSAVFINKLAEKTALGRIGKPDELQGAVVFLCSNAASFITGHNLVVDGGWTIK